MKDQPPPPKKKSEPDPRFNRIRWLSVVGGFLNGIRMDFAPGLNCLIGARGTGKTTVLEFVRFALDAMPEDVAARRRIDALINKNLGSGRIELGIETKDGISYIVTRSAGEDPIVLSGERKPTEITLKAGAVFKADVFSQNEVENIADRSLSLLDLIDNFQADQISQLDAEIRAVQSQLTSNSHALVPLQERIAALTEDLATLPGVEDKLKSMAAEAGPDAKPINEAHTQKALRDRQKRAVEGIGKFLVEHQESIGSLAGLLSQEVESQISDDILSDPNAPILADIRKGLIECARDVDLQLKKAQERISIELTSLDANWAKLTAAHRAQDMAFRALIEKHKEAMAKLSERSSTEKTRNDLLGKKREIQEVDGRRAKCQAERTVLLGKLSDLREQRFKVRNGIAEIINATLAPNIKVGVKQDGDKTLYISCLEDLLRGARVKQGAVAQKIADSMWPVDIVKIVREKSVDELVDKAELNPDQADKVVVALSQSERLHELECVEILDAPAVEMKDGESYKDSQSLSTGQKCTAILPILLMESEKPLLVDQPEDNLDNRFISQTVVQSLQKVKAHRQLIFVTHNPNIPVLGDAARVFALESDGVNARVLKAGTVDECKNEIVTLLEGGEEAFRNRQKRYKY